MEKKRVIKKSVIRNGIILLVALILIIGGIKLINYYTSDYFKLTKLGYSKEIALEIIDMDKSNRVLNLEYNDAIPDFMKEQYYIDSNLEKYLEYHKNHNNELSDVVAIVNVHADNEFYSVHFDTDTSKGKAMLVNKFYGLSSDYAPDDLYQVSNWYAYGSQTISEEVYDQFILMFEAAKKENLTLIINDSYRSYEDQEKTHKTYGDDYAARAGHSEHNTGLSIDIISPGYSGEDFEESDEYKWLSKHAHEYGFILRYPKDKEYLTGYEYESWHYRYLGIELATKVFNSGLTYDEYYAYYLDD